MIRFVYPNVAGLDDDFIGCGRFLAALPGAPILTAGYERAQPNVVHLDRIMTVAALTVSRLIAPGALSGEIVACAALTGLFRAAYIIMLFLAYGHADLSVAYPLSRGVAPLVALPLAGVLLGDAVYYSSRWPVWR